MMVLKFLTFLTCGGVLPSIGMAIEDAAMEFARAPLNQELPPDSWQPYEQGTVFEGHQAVWLRVTHNQPADRTIKIFSDRLKEVKAHTPDGLVKLKKGRSNHPYYSYKTTQSILQIHLPGTDRFNVEVIPTEEYYSQAKVIDMVFLISLGISLGLLAYNLFIFVSIRERSHIYYVVYILLSICVSGLVSGGYYLFWPEGPTNDYTDLSVLVMLIAAMFFMSELVGLKENHPRLYRVIQALALVDLMTIGLIFSTPAPFYEPIVYAFYFLATPTTIGTAYYSWRKGFRPARYFVFSFGALAFFGFMTLFRAIDPIYFPYYFDLGFPIGFSAELILMSFALSDKVALLKEQLHHLLKEENLYLEAKVKERTHQIEMHQAEIVAKSRLASLGEMAGGIAHEINNPLAIIMGYMNVTERFSEHLPPDKQEAFLENLAKSKRVSKRIAHVVQSLLLFVRETDDASFVEVSLNEVVSRASSFTSAKFAKHDILFTSEAIDQDASVYCHQVQLVEVLMSLLQNSFDALKEVEGEKKINVASSLADGRAHISVIDNGPGIPADLADRIFEPFFSTKGVGGGAGLGLSTAKGIIEAMNGSLTLHQSDGTTKFTIELPQKAPTFKAA